MGLGFLEISGSLKLLIFVCYLLFSPALPNRAPGDIIDSLIQLLFGVQCDTLLKMMKMVVFALRQLTVIGKGHHQAVSVIN